MTIDQNMSVHTSFGTVWLVGNKILLYSTDILSENINFLSA